MAGVPGPRLGAGGRGDARQDRGRPSQCHRSLAGDCLRPRVSLRRRAPAAGVGAIATRRGGGRVMSGPLKIAALSLSAAALAAGLATACSAEEDRKSVGLGKSVSVRGELGGCRCIKKKKTKKFT